MVAKGLLGSMPMWSVDRISCRLSVPPTGKGEETRYYRSHASIRRSRGGTQLSFPHSKFLSGKNIAKSESIVPPDCPITGRLPKPFMRTEFAKFAPFSNP